MLVIGFAKDPSHLKIRPRCVKKPKTPLQQAIERQKATRRRKHQIHPASLCPKPHGLPCLAHRKVVDGLLKPCAICEPYLATVRGSLETQAILSRQKIEGEDAVARQRTKAHIEAENSVTAVAKRNDYSVPSPAALMLGIRKTLEHDKKNIADLARELSAMSKREYKYHQVYNWVIQERFRPQSEALFDLLAWYKSHASRNAIPSK